MLITYMYMPTDMYYYILDLSPLFLGCYLRPGLGSSTLHQVQVQVQVFQIQDLSEIGGGGGGYN